MYTTLTWLKDNQKWLYDILVADWITGCYRGTDGLDTDPCLRTYWSYWQAGIIMTWFTIFYGSIILGCFGWWAYKSTIEGTEGGTEEFLKSIADMNEQGGYNIRYPNFN